MLSIKCELSILLDKSPLAHKTRKNTIKFCFTFDRAPELSLIKVKLYNSGRVGILLKQL